MHRRLAPALLVVAGLIPFAGEQPAVAAAPPAPAGVHVFSASETALPGRVAGLQGTGFGAAPDVRFDVVSASDAQVVPDQPVQLLARSDRVVHAVVPSSAPVGLYAFTVNGEGLTFVNRAHAQNVEFEQVSPGYPFRVFGRALELPGAMPTVRFVAPDGTSVPGVVDLAKTDEHELTVAAPTGLIPGTTYELVVSNGYGGVWGEATADRTVTAVAGGPGAALDPFGIRTPWAAQLADIAQNVVDVTQPRGVLGLRAVPNDGGDDTLAIQGAIDEAAADGGGTVLFPAGTYDVAQGRAGLPQSAIALRSGVVLKGAGLGADGRPLSTLRATGHTSGMTFDLPAGTHRAGLVEIGMDAQGLGGNSWNYQDRGSDVGEIFVVRSRLTSTTPGNLFWAGAWNNNTPVGPFEFGCSQKEQYCWRNVAIRDNVLVSGSAPGQQWVAALQLSNVDGGVVTGNDITWPGDRLYFKNSRDLTIEGNRLDYRALTTLTQGGAFWFDYTITSQVLRNTFLASPTPYTGAGEALAIEGYTIDSAGSHYGATAAASASTVSLPAQKTGAYTQADAYTGWTVAVVDGPGAGQFRTVTGSSYDQGTGRYTWTVDRPWDVQPAVGVNVSVVMSINDFLIRGNTFDHTARPIWVYNVSTRDLVVVENTVTDGEAIQLRSDYRVANNGDGFHAMENPYAAGNSVTRTAIDANGGNPACYISYNVQELRYPTLGTHLFLPELRDNSVSCTRPSWPDTPRDYDPVGSKIDGIWVYAKDRTEPSLDAPLRGGQPDAIVGAILDGNSVAHTDNAYTSGTGVADTSIWRSTHTADIGRFLRDDKGSGSTIGTRNLYGPDGTRLTPAEPPAAGAAYTASSTNALGGGATTPDKAFDGNLSTFWQADGAATPPHWVEAASATTSTFQRVVVSSYRDGDASGAPQRIESAGVLVEDASGQLVEVASFNDNTQVDRVVVLPAPVTTKRLRIEVRGYTIAGVPSTSGVVAEVATGPLGDEDPPPPAPDAFTASSQYLFGNYRAEHAFDGVIPTNDSNGWYSSEQEALPQWLQADFGTPRRTDSLTLHGRVDIPHRTTDVDIQITAADGAVVTKTVRGNTQQDLVVPLDAPVDVDLLRITVRKVTHTDGSDFHAVFLREVELSDVGGGAGAVEVAAPVVSGGQAEGEGVVVRSAVSSVSPGAACEVDFGDGARLAGTIAADACTAPVHAYADNGTYVITVVVTDATGSASATAAHEVRNAAPAVGEPQVAAVGRSPRDVAASAGFTDAGLGDTHTCTVDYGDGTAAQPGILGAGECQGPNHTYKRKGSYDVTVSVTDDDGATTARRATYTV